MNPWAWVDPRVKSVRFSDVQAYFERQGWKAKPAPNPDFVRFEKKVGRRGRPWFQIFPGGDDFDTFPKSVTELITTLSELENRHPVEILNDMLNARQIPEDGDRPRSKRRKAVSK